MTIDMRKPEGNRITDLKVRCGADCKNAIDINSISYEEIVPNKEYPVVGTKFLFGGNDGYKDLKKSYRDKIEGTFLSSPQYGFFWFRNNLNRIC